VRTFPPASAVNLTLVPPTLFVLFGATGDLARRKIAPALFNLFLGGELPERFRLLCVGRRGWDAARMADQLEEGVTRYSRRGAPAPEAWASFRSHVTYFEADLLAQESYARLGEQVAAAAREWGAPPEVVLYLAVPPDLMTAVTDGLGSAGLAADREHARVVVEKPLGRDLDSFRAINGQLGRHFLESQIFRIDHYLGKETVQNVLALRFGNPMFEPVWNRQFVDHVVVTVAEREGIGSRGGYYEEAGALRDMVQNHLLQLLCLVAMEPPSDYSAMDLRNHKMDVLRAIVPIDPEAVATAAVRGQYRGYRQEPGVAAASNVETFAALKLEIENWRWQGVPFYLRSGKCMREELSEIAIRFRRVPHCFFPACEGLNGQPAELLFQIKPVEGVTVHMMAKVPGYRLELRPVSMRFEYAQDFGADIPEAYETLLRDVLLGDPTLFMRSDQVEAAWALLEPVLRAWGRLAGPPPDYEPGSWGPEAARALIEKDGRQWNYPVS
jgi:glucose-6-phosphate 1-dehydrogenase